MLPSLLYRDPRSARKGVMPHANDLAADLNLTAVIRAMAGEDRQIEDIARRVLFERAPIGSDDLQMRQEIIADAVENHAAFASMYGVLQSGLSKHAQSYHSAQPGYARFVPTVDRIRTAAGLQAILLSMAWELRGLLQEHQYGFRSQAMRGYAEAFLSLFTTDFIEAAKNRCAELSGLSEGHAVSIGYSIGNGLKISAPVIGSLNAQTNASKKPKRHPRSILLDNVSLQSKALELKNDVLMRLLHMLSAVNEQMSRCLKALMLELGFYHGCAQLHRKLLEIGVSVCFPQIDRDGGRALSFAGLVDVGLAVQGGRVPVGNTLALDQSGVIVVTGANQGGKSTFLRSFGCAQLMMRCGMFVSAEGFRGAPHPQVYTHFCRQEDERMQSGKLDEELARMDRIVDELEPNALLLMNESFSSTSDREGAYIAGELVDALDALGIHVVFVTHLYDFARELSEKASPHHRYLQAGRQPDGKRSFIIEEGMPLHTSHGMDLYRAIMGS